MPKPKNLHFQPEEGKQEDSEASIKTEKSLLSEFVEREIPADEDLEKFEEYVHEEAREHEIDEGLSEIYQNDNGDMVDVKTMDVKKKRGLLFNVFIIFLSIAFFASAGWFAYNFISSTVGVDPTAVAITIDSPDKVIAGEEFFYLIKYKNLYNVNLNNVEIKITYPDNFIFLDSSPVLEDGVWKIPSLGMSEDGEIKIKGKIVDSNDKVSAVLVEISYFPANFSSEFKKEISKEITVSDIGIDLDFDEISSALVGEENEVVVKYVAKKENYIKNFRISVEKPDNMSIVFSEEEKKNRPDDYKENTWLVSDLSEEEQEVVIKFKFNEKINNNEILLFNFEYSEDGEKYYNFFTKEMQLEIIKSDLSLVLISNGSRDSQAINFGDTLNYSLSYENKGEFEMKDVVLMAVLEGASLDWKTLKSGGGKTSNNTITWSKQELPDLETLHGGDKGVIDFSIKLMNLEDVDLDSNTSFSKFEVKSYAQFNIGNREEVSENEDTKSNTIINKINSNLKLDEKVKYFNDDNIAVGFGPVPPKVGETTSYKVYWTITNNLHELGGLRVETKLPSYVQWMEKESADAGSVFYDSMNNKVIWDIGRLPESIYKVNAEFSIGITPVDSDANTIKILLSDTTVSAIDVETQADIVVKGGGKTTKLEDDSIAISDGRINR